MKVAHDLQADDEKVQKKVAKKLARQQVRAAIILPNLLKKLHYVNNFCFSDVHVTQACMLTSYFLFFLMPGSPANNTAKESWFIFPSASI